MADISSITLLDGVTYNLKDAEARNSIPVEMTSSQAQAGTSSISMSISPSILKEAILTHSYWQYNSTTDSIDLIFPN